MLLVPDVKSQPKEERDSSEVKCQEDVIEKGTGTRRKEIS